MSSTNRSNARDFHKSDYYITPKKHIDDFLSQFLSTIQHTTPYNLKALDPCAWWDALNDMAYPSVLQKYGITPVTNDLRNDSPATHHTDFLCWDDSDNQYDLIITNPPFSHALPIIEKALQLTKEWWYIIMLLRLNFFWSKWRREFFKHHMPTHCFIHHERMSFTPDNQTDSIEYAHFVWTKWENPSHTKTYLI